MSCVSWVTLLNTERAYLIEHVKTIINIEKTTAMIIDIWKLQLIT